LKAEDCVCDGCLDDGCREGRRIGYCRTCAVRACAIARGLENCAHCADYGCEKLVVCFEHSAETKVVLDRVRQSLIRQGLVRQRPAFDVRDASQVERFLARPEIKTLLAEWVNDIRHAEKLSDAPWQGVVYKVHADHGACVVRFPVSEEQEVALVREARITKALRPLVDIDLPEPTVFPAEGERPALAVHPWVDGEPLTPEMYEQMSETSKDGLACDLAGFLAAVHAIDLAQAAAWCGDEGAEYWTQPGYGKPGWFGDDLRARIPGALNPHLEPRLVSAVAEAVQGFEALAVSGTDLVFAHGDIHGFNLAMRPTARGYALGGVIDFGIAGIQDAHEDFFRLYFIASDLVERTVAAYEGLRQASLDRARIDLYWRAFLIYLMVEHLEMGTIEPFELYKRLFIQTVIAKGEIWA
jgi:aminoglycoside phosphotransferase (APT) family kinase protein